MGALTCGESDGEWSGGDGERDGTPYDDDECDEHHPSEHEHQKNQQKPFYTSNAESFGTTGVMRSYDQSVSVANRGSHHRVPGCGPPTPPPRTRTETNTDPLSVHRRLTPGCGDVTDP